MKIDSTLISRLEQLARLELSEAEKIKLQGDLNSILEMVKQLDELDTSGVEPLLHMSSEVNVWREDEVKGQLDREAALRNAPMSDEQYFKVPKVINIKKS